eukprot:TRINITY_DN7392_c2_g1_i1.p3 TRINITY_DN7392_c2_g1~~TRINITY_DN7392_c2_g1_i1.p3  ORF type:complete len:156 (-),score=25.85 TRINITY_DN7392_c2_g1_i1:659-1069(-)
MDDFYCGDIPNPHLQRHYQVLEAVALEQPVPEIETLKDATLPEQDALENYKEEMNELKQTVYGNMYDQLAFQTSKKRKPTTSAHNYDSFNWKQLAEDNKLNKLTVNDLKIYLAQHRLGVSGKKADLIDRICTHLKV